MENCRKRTQRPQGVDSYPLEHKLRYSVSRYDLEFRLGVIEQQYFDLTPVVGVYDTCTSVDEVLRRKA